MDVTAPTSRSSRTRLRAKTVSLNSEKRTFERVASLNEVLEGLHLQGPSAVQPFMVSDIVREAESDPDLFDFPRCMSPISDRTCSGDCLESPTAKPDVVSFLIHVYIYL